MTFREVSTVLTWQCIIDRLKHNLDSLFRGHSNWTSRFLIKTAKHLKKNSKFINIHFITIKLFTKPFYDVGRNTNWCTIPGSKSGKMCSKFKNMHTLNIAILLLKFILRIQSQLFCRLSYRYDCCNTVYNSKKWEMAIMFNKIGLIKVHYAILYNGIWVKHLKQ